EDPRPLPPRVAPRHRSPRRSPTDRLAPEPAVTAVSLTAVSDVAALQVSDVAAVQRCSSEAVLPEAGGADVLQAPLGGGLGGGLGLVVAMDREGLVLQGECAGERGFGSAAAVVADVVREGVD